MKLQIENFQSIKEANLEFQVGFTTIVGPSNRGKSSLVRALRAVLYNSWNVSFINNTSKICRVDLEFSPEELKFNPNLKVQTISLLKSSTRNEFKIKDSDDIEHSLMKAGRGPLELLEKSGFGVIHSERNDKFNVHFQTQFEPLFLLTLSPEALTSFLNSIFKVEKYERALRAISSDILKFNRRFTELGALKIKIDGDINDLSNSIKADQEFFNTINSLKIKLNDESTRLNSLNAISDIIATLIQRNEDLENKTKEVKSNLWIVKLLILKIGEILNLKNLKRIESNLDEKLINFRNLSKKFSQLTSISTSYNTVLESLALKSGYISNIKQFDSQKKLYLTRVKGVNQSIRIFDRLKQAVSNRELLNRRINLINEYSNKALDISRSNEKVSTLKGILNKFNFLISKRQSYVSYVNAIYFKDTSFKVSRGRQIFLLELIESFQKVEIQLKKDIGKCPLCEGNIN